MRKFLIAALYIRTFIFSILPVLIGLMLGSLFTIGIVSLDIQVKISILLFCVLLFFASMLMRKFILKK